MRNGQDVLQDDRGFRLFAAAGVAVVALVGFLSLPRTFWEFDELLFAWGILDFDPRNHHPHPPGYPLLVGLGKAINLVAVDPFNALLFLSFLSTVTGFVALCFLFRNVLGESRAAVLGALVFAMSPAMLVNGMLPMSDPPALLFLILALALASTFPESLTNRRALLFGLFCAASIGCRPQYAVPILPMFFFVLGRSRDWPRIQIALATFTVTCLAWLVPLIDAVGGVSALVAFEKKQAAYVATHDASVSRGAHSFGDLLVRFGAHPWGPKWLALPILSLAVIGAIRLIRQRAARAIPVLIVLAIHLAFCLTSMDPADAVRYALPSLIGVGLAVAAGFGSLIEATQFDLAPSMFVALFAVGSFLYVRPITGIRHRGISPPLQAVGWARGNLPSGSVVLYETSLRPHAEFLMGRFHPLPLERGLQLLANRPDVPLYAFADGGSPEPGAIRFAWPESDAYGKLTRDHYRVVSLVPIPMTRRYLVLKGVYPFERTASGKEWRWLDQHAGLVMSPAPGRHVTMSFYLPPDAPEQSTHVTVRTAGSSNDVLVRRGQISTVSMPIPAGPVRVDFDSATAYVPASTVGNRDPRHLSVQLTFLERRP